jgi:hypothetical protein
MTSFRISLSLLLCLLLMLSACKQTDKCESLTCQHGGTCEDGFCRCPEGYVGSLCELKDNPCDRASCNATGTDSCHVVNNVATCVCLTGFMGKNCDSVWATQYLGSYTVTETCTKPGGAQEEITYNTPVRGGTKFNSIEISKFHNATSARLIVDVIQKNALSIVVQPMMFVFPPDTTKAFVEGSGGNNPALPEGSFFLSYTLVPLYTTDTTRCYASYLRQ